MIRAGKPRRKPAAQVSRTDAHAQRTPPEEPSSAIPQACGCGAPWDLSFPGDAGPPVRETIVLCFACARERGWPNQQNPGTAMSGQLSSGTVPPLPSKEIDGFEAAFEAFWKAFPKRPNNPKHPARIAFDRALKKADLSEIMAGLARYEFSPEPKYRPMVVTWLNQRRWQVENEDLSLDAYGIGEWLKTLPRDGLLSALSYDIEELRDIMVATGLPPTWRGPLETLNRWMVDGYSPVSCARAVDAAVAEIGTRTSLVPFDKRVRQRAFRVTGK
jgi:hypothetical protein